MTIRSRLRALFGPTLKKYPRVWRRIVSLDAGIETTRNVAARMLPVLIRPEPRRIDIAITAHCNLRCVGCRYGRDFMPGRQLPWRITRDLLNDAAAAGIWEARFYGGEPLLHPDLPRMIEHATSLGMDTYVTTNAILLGRRVQELYDAGLRTVTIGYYGTGAKYDSYVQRKRRYGELESSVAEVRRRYGSEINLRINWLLMRPSCNLPDLHAAVAFAQRYSMRIQVDLIHYSLPYFSEGPDRELQFRPEDRPAIERIVAELLRLQDGNPGLFNQSAEGLASIPDWLIRGPAMRVACDAYQMLWVGADGSVQQCYVTFPLGNLHEQRLSQMLYTPAHRRAARDAFAVNCPNCHCGYDTRIGKQPRMAAKYRAFSDALVARGNGQPAAVEPKAGWDSAPSLVYRATERQYSTADQAADDL
jgi:MoaA/NifB/PqqE/SkfB family radical SAM enzyme